MGDTKPLHTDLQQPLLSKQIHPATPSASPSLGWVALHCCTSKVLQSTVCATSYLSQWTLLPRHDSKGSITMQTTNPIMVQSTYQVAEAIVLLQSHLPATLHTCLSLTVHQQYNSAGTHSTCVWTRARCSLSPRLQLTAVLQETPRPANPRMSRTTSCCLQAPDKLFREFLPAPRDTPAHQEHLPKQLPAHTTRAPPDHKHNGCSSIRCSCCAHCELCLFLTSLTAS